MKKVIDSLILLLVSGVALSQTSDSVILRAMKDELDRNMKELRYDGFEKPFYISYGIDDIAEYQVAATMGALMRSSDKQSRTKNIRVLVGDYEFNDESLDNSNFSAPEANEIAMPLDDDYFGIRRSLWVTTDYIYKNAARQFKKNRETLREKNKPLTEMPHRRFASQPVYAIKESSTPYQMNLPAIEKMVKELSSVFKDYPAIDYSSAYLSYVDGYTYFINSEGTVSVTSLRQASINVYAQRKTEEGETIHDQIIHQTFSPEQFPTLSELKDQVRKFCDALCAEPFKVIEEEYSGPVLIVGQPVAEILGRIFFASRDALNASDALPDPRGYSKQDQNSLIDSKVGRLVVSETMSVTVKPTLKSFQGIPLLGYYRIDREGVVPKDALTLIDKGILKNLVNDRSLLKPEEVATGHASGPGIVEVNIAGGTPLKALKEQLIAEAKKQGLEYALIIRKSGADPSSGSFLTRVSVKDGKEDPFRGGVLLPLALKDLKNLMGATNSSKAYNLHGGDQGSSYIVPEAILMKDVEIGRAEIRLMKEEHYVSSPVPKK